MQMFRPIASDNRGFTILCNGFHVGGDAFDATVPVIKCYTYLLLILG